MTCGWITSGHMVAKSQVPAEDVELQAVELIGSLKWVVCGRYSLQVDAKVCGIPND